MADNYKDIQKDLKSFERDLKKSLKDKLKSWSDRITNNIKTKWEKGEGSNASGETVKFKELSSETIKNRQRLAKSTKSKKKLSNRTSPSKSNMIMTGKAIDSLKNKQNKNNLEIDIFIKGEENQAKLKHNEDSRPIMFLSKEDQEIIDEEIDSMIDKLFK